MLTKSRFFAKMHLIARAFSLRSRATDRWADCPNSRAQGKSRRPLRCLAIKIYPSRSNWAESRDESRSRCKARTRYRERLVCSESSVAWPGSERQSLFEHRTAASSLSLSLSQRKRASPWPWPSHRSSNKRTRTYAHNIHPATTERPVCTLDTYTTHKMSLS